MDLALDLVQNLMFENLYIYTYKCVLFSQKLVI